MAEKAAEFVKSGSEIYHGNLFDRMRLFELRKAVF